MSATSFSKKLSRNSGRAACHREEIDSPRRTSPGSFGSRSLFGCFDRPPGGSRRQAGTAPSAPISFHVTAHERTDYIPPTFSSARVTFCRLPAVVLLWENQRILIGEASTASALCEVAMSWPPVWNALRMVIYGKRRTSEGAKKLSGSSQKQSSGPRRLRRRQATTRAEHYIFRRLRGPKGSVTYSLLGPRPGELDLQATGKTFL